MCLSNTNLLVHVHTPTHTPHISHTLHYTNTLLTSYTPLTWHPHTPHNIPSQAAHKAQEEAELQRVREQSKFQEELNRRQHLEDELRANQQRPPTPIDTGDTGNQVERLLKIEQKQKLEIKRYS